MVDVAVGGGHGVTKAGPVALTVFRRDDEIERLSDSVRGAVFKHGLRARIPDADDAGGLSENKCSCGLRHATPPAEDA
jgi:hypothetical protein